MFEFTVITKEGEVYYDNYFDLHNCYEAGMIVIDNRNEMFYNGKEWKDIDVNHL